MSINLRIDKPYDDFFNSDLYKELLNYLPAQKIKTLDFYDDFKGVIQKEDLPIGTEFRENVDKSEPCYALYRTLEVLKDGTIQGCTCRVEPELQGENIMSFSTIKEAWNSPILNNIREKWHSGTIPECCKTCSHYAPYTTNYKKKNIKNNLKSIILHYIVKFGFKKYLYNYKIYKQLKEIEK